jgi:hypothetical protein
MQTRILIAGARGAGFHLATALRFALLWRPAALARPCVKQNLARVYFFS